MNISRDVSPGRIGWCFPPTSGGPEDGFRDAGMEHFSGSPTAALAREIIQNSLDARACPDEPVHVAFERVDVRLPAAFDRDALRARMRACSQRVTESHGKQFFANAESLLDRAELPFLRISDKNTTGLRPDEWRALVKSRGISVKGAEDAGGSYGIGKSAPFIISDLRTVLYGTAYEQDGQVHEKFQGRSILMSHEAEIDGERQTTQGTGFLGWVQDCRELTGKDCPSEFRYLDGGGPVLGTAIWIAAPRVEGGWRRELARSVVENYFFALNEGSLEVLLEPDDGADEAIWDIRRDTLGKVFGALDSDRDADLQQARVFWKMVAGAGEPGTEERLWQNDVLGDCRLWIRVAKGLSSRLGLIRGTGMLITTNQKRLRRFPGTRDFAAVCVFESSKANDLLRSMENPRHDQFEPDRLPEPKRDRTRKELRAFAEWVREQIKEVAGHKVQAVDDNLAELAQHLPDELGEGALSEGPEKSFGAPGEVRLRRPRLRRVRGTRIAEPTEDGEGPQDDDGEGADGHGGTGEGAGSGTGEGAGSGAGGGGGRSGTRGVRRRPETAPLEVKDIRILARSENENEMRLIFTPMASAVVRLTLHESGDSSTARRRDLLVVHTDGSLTEFDKHKIRVTEGTRTGLILRGAASVSRRSWSLLVHAVEETP